MNPKYKAKVYISFSIGGVENPHFLQKAENFTKIKIKIINQQKTQTNKNKQKPQNVYNIHVAIWLCPEVAVAAASKPALAFRDPETTALLINGLVLLQAAELILELSFPRISKEYPRIT